MSLQLTLALMLTFFDVRASPELAHLSAMELEEHALRWSYSEGTIW